MESAKQATLASQSESPSPAQPNSPSPTTMPTASGMPTNRILNQGSSSAATSCSGVASSGMTGAPPADRMGAAGVTSIAPRADGSQVSVLAVPDEALTEAEKAIEILRMAGEAFARNGNWVVFYRDMLGVNGLARRTFNTEAKFDQFQKMPQFAELQEMVAALRSQDTSKGDAVEPEKMITIRLPESLHQVLTTEAEAMNLSINKLCISKLLQPVESRFVPVQQGRRRGRRPGPQGSRKSSS